MNNKEQIIIDGVDVRTCDSFIDYYMVDETRFQDVSEDIIEQDKLPVVYKGLPDCLLRKNLCNAYTCHCKDKPNCNFKQLARKTQECEIWKNQVLILDEEDVTVEVTQEQFEEYKQLKQECEELKSELHLYKTWYRAKHGDIKNILGRYHKALDEIEEYTRKQFCENCDDFNTTEYNSHCENCEYYEYFDIINKAKGNNYE